MKEMYRERRAFAVVETTAQDLRCAFEDSRQESRIHGDRCGRAGADDWRQYGDVQRADCPAVAAASI
jgi:hypothetical protein